MTLDQLYFLAAGCGCGGIMCGCGRRGSVLPRYRLGARDGLTTGRWEPEVVGCGGVARAGGHGARECGVDAAVMAWSRRAGT